MNYPSAPHDPTTQAPTTTQAGAWLPPAQSGASRRPGRRRLKLAAIVVASALVVGIGVVAGWQLLKPETHTIEFSAPAPPSNEWAKGAQQVWQMPMANMAGGQYVVSDTLLVYSDGELAAYAPLDASMSRIWRISFDVEGLLPQSTDREVAEKYYPYFKAWGDDAAIYGNRIIDLASGEVLEGPWPPELPLAVAGDVAISCDGTKCTAWKAGRVDEPLWEATVAEADKPGTLLNGYSSVTGYQPVIEHNGVRFVILGSDVVNLDTGEALPLRDAPDEGRRIVPALDGWLVERRGRFEAYTIRGKRVEDLDADFSEDDSFEPVIPLARLASLEELKQSFEDPTESALAVSSSGCAARIMSGEFGEFDPPESCVRFVVASPDSSVFLTQSYANPANTSIDALINTETGQAVEFPEVDTEETFTGVFSVSPTLILVEDYTNRRMVAYSPKP